MTCNTMAGDTSELPMAEADFAVNDRHPIG